MDQESQNPPPGLRHLNLKKSFKLGIRSLLTACSKEDFSKAFSMFNNAEQEGLHRLFLQVITSMHENIEEQFESICRETEVGTILDIVEQFVEEQTLDTLSTDKTNIDVVEQELSRAKKDEIQYLTSMLDTAMEHNRLIKARIESLKERQDLSTIEDTVGKLRSWNCNYGQI